MALRKPDREVTPNRTQNAPAEHVVTNQFAAEWSYQRSGL